MKRAWTGLAMLAGAWLFTSDYYHHADGWMWLAWSVLILAGTALVGGQLPRLPGRNESLAAGLMVLPVAWLLAWPARTGAILLAAGFLAGAFPAPGPKRRWAASGALVAGTLLLTQQLAMYFYEVFTARSHELPGPLAWLVARMAAWLGADSALTDNAVALFTMRQTNMLAPSWELLLDPESLCFLAGGAALLLLSRRASWRTWAGLVGAVALWLPVRSGLLMGGYLHRILRTDYDAPLNAMNMFWSPWLHLILLAGPMLLVWKLARPCCPEAAPEAQRPPLPATWSWRRWALPAGLALGAGLLTAAVFVDLPGRQNPGTILFHELLATDANPAWERVDKPYDTSWYGHLSGYNYRCIYDYLGKFYDVERRTDRLTDATLKNVAVLVLKTPTARYNSAEVDCVKRFVNAGGGLLLIGEHTDVFGTGTNLNDFARPLGFEFRYDCLFDVDHIFDEYWRPAAVKHPIVAGMKNFDFAVSCSIEPGWTPGRAVIRTPGLKSLPPDYHASNFYPIVEDRPDMRYGAFIQLWSQRYGQGRVVAFTDSTVLSNFAAFEPGKPELLMGMVDWLHRTGGFRYAWLLLGLGGMGALAAGVVLGRGHVAGWALPLASVLLGWCVAILAARAVNGAVLPQPDNVRPITKVVIDQALCDVPLSKSGFIGGDARGFGIFERWILRLGYFTWREADVPDEDTALLVLPFPTGSVSGEYLDRLVKYVGRGGHVLVLDSPENVKSSANSVLWPFRLALNNQSPAVSGVLSAPGAATTGPATRPSGSTLPSVQDVLRASPPITATPVWEVTGGKPLALIGDKPVIATARHGKGTVTLVGCGALFTDANMGGTGDVEPTEPLKRVYDLQFSLIRSLAQPGADK